MNLLQTRFTTGQIVEATGVTNSALQSWLKRDLVVGHRQSPISGGGSPGRHRGYSFFNAMEIALAKGLTDLGLSDLKGVVFPAASRFAHSASGKRLPGLPFNSITDPGFTLLCTAGDRSTTYLLTPNDEAFYAVVRHALGSPAGFTVLHVNPIFEAVTHALGFDYRDVLKAAYSSGAAA